MGFLYLKPLAGLSFSVKVGLEGRVEIAGGKVNKYLNRCLSQYPEQCSVENISHYT